MKKLYEEAEQCNLNIIEGFIRKLFQDYKWDNTSISHAISIAAIAGAYSGKAVSNSSTGWYPSRKVTSLFVKNWDDRFKDAPFEIISYEDFLYPQLLHSYTELSVDTFNWIQNKAKENLEDLLYVHEDVLKHWESLADGKVPENFTINNQKEISKWN